MRHTFRCLSVGLVAGLTLFGLALAARADVVAPSAQTAVEGNTNNAFPFNIAAFDFPSERYQQVFDASEFGGPRS
jgi:hypothetical protein